MIRWRPAHRRGGFTLIEVLVATTILATIFGIVFGTLFYTVNNAEEREERASLYQRASFILNNISQNVSSAYIPYAGGYLDMEGTVEEKKPAFLGVDNSIEEFDADSLNAFTTNPRYGARTQAGELAFVNYEVVSYGDYDGAGVAEDMNNPLLLTCAVEPLLMKKSGETTMEPQWALNIRSLNLQYFDGAEWLSEWTYEDQGMLPKAVKIELQLGDSDENSHIFSTIARVHVDALLKEVEEPSPLEEDSTDEEEQSEETVEEEQPESEGQDTGEEPNS